MKNGLISYVRRGYKFPPIELIHSYQKSLKNICLSFQAERKDNSQLYDIKGIIPIITFKNNRHVVCFNQITRNFITDYKMRVGAIRRFEETNKIGGQQ